MVDMRILKWLHSIVIVDILNEYDEERKRKMMTEFRMIRSEKMSSS